jgi:hypothetical protein
MKKIFFLFFFIILTFQIAFSQEEHLQSPQSGCADIKPYVNPCPNNSVQKPGWNLILNENFQPAGRAKRWNKSKCEDDAGCGEKFGFNTDNVTYSLYNPNNFDGNQNPPPAYQQYLAQLWNTLNPTGCPSCPYSKGELKTMSVKDSSFKSYYFYGPGYIEAKVKLYALRGQGAAMYLWAVQDCDDFGLPPHDFRLDNQEIDVFETLTNSSNQYNVNYHWKTETGDSVDESHTVILQNHQFTDWTIFGIEWNENMIQWTVNNTVIHTLYMSQTPAPKCPHHGIRYYPPTAPFCLRFNSGANGVGFDEEIDTNSLPQHFSIEYIRAYKKTGVKISPIKIWLNKNTICQTENSPNTSDNIITANYYPDATYEWSSPAFDITPFRITDSITAPHQHYNKLKVSCKSGVTLGFAPIYLKTSLPWGYTENDTVWMNVISLPSQPGSIFNPTLQEFNCKFYLNHPIDDPSVTMAQWSCATTNQYGRVAELIYENGVATEANLYGNWEPDQYIEITYQDFNSCASPVRIKTIYIPQLPDTPCFK